MFIALQFSQLGLAEPGGAWLAPLALLLAPFILLAPMNGALSNCLPKQAVLAGSAAFCFCRTALFGVVASGRTEAWLGCLGLGLIGTGHAIYSAARYALLPHAAQQARWPLSRVIGWMEMGSIAGSVAGLLLGSSLHPVSWPEALTILPWQASLARAMEQWPFPVAVAAFLGFELVALLAAFAVQFPADVRRPEQATKALAGFVHDSQAILKDIPARGSLLGLAYFMGLIVAGGIAAALAHQAGMEPTPVGSVGEPAIIQVLWLVGLGAAGGCLLAVVQGNPRRVLGLVPPAAMGLAAALAWTAADPQRARVYLLLGLLGGLMIVPLRTGYLFVLPAGARGNGVALMNAATALSLGLAALFVSALTRLGILMPQGQLWLLAALAALGALWAWRVLLRETIEQVGEMLLWPMYRIRVRGPGIQQIPPRGPLLVIANHTTWFDPLWLAKILPRTVTPMMTSRFFDLPILHWLMRDVAGAVRVVEAAYRREAPELAEAVAALDRGDCLLVFPEGALKRRPEQSLRRFGQGVWRILRQRPETPVVACWIEGGWGSFASYSGGPPAVNKHLDWWRPIEIGMESPQVVDPAILAGQHATRDYLMRACLSARRFLGREPLPLPPLAIGQPDGNAHLEKA